MSKKIGKVVKKATKIESLLKKNGAEGNGINNQVNSIQDKLTPSLIGKLRWIASIRNKAVHDENYEIKDIERYKNTSEEIITELEEVNNKQTTQEESTIFYILIFVTIVFFYFYSGDSKEEIQKKVDAIDFKIENLNNDISNNENQILNKKNKLDTEIKSQGLIHSILKDTDIVNKLEVEVESLEDTISELKDEKEELSEEKKDLIKDLN